MKHHWLNKYGIQVKRPLGVMPREIAIDEWEDNVRFPQLKEAIQRFIDAELAVPHVIYAEYCEIVAKRQEIVKKFEEDRNG